MLHTRTAVTNVVESDSTSYSPSRRFHTAGCKSLLGLIMIMMMQRQTYSCTSCEQGSADWLIFLTQSTSLYFLLITPEPEKARSTEQRQGKAFFSHYRTRKYWYLEPFFLSFLTLLPPPPSSLSLLIQNENAVVSKCAIARRCQRWSSSSKVGRVSRCRYVGNIGSAPCSRC